MIDLNKLGEMEATLTNLTIGGVQFTGELKGTQFVPVMAKIPSEIIGSLIEAHLERCGVPKGAMSVSFNIESYEDAELKEAVVSIKPTAPKRV